MTQAAINYGRVLYDLQIPKETVKEVQRMLETPELKQALEDPLVTGRQKQAVIDHIGAEAQVPVKLCNFLKVLLGHGRMGSVEEIFLAYDQCTLKAQNVLRAELHYVTAPSAEQLERIRQMLCSKYKTTDAVLTMVEEPALMGGFIIRAGDTEMDWSVKGRLKQLEQALLR